MRRLSQRHFFILYILLACLLYACDGITEEKKILVFHKTAGYRHESIPDGIKAIMNMGETKGIQVDTTSNSEVFVDSILKKYSTIVFLNTSGNVFESNQRIAFERYIQAGGGFVGVHATTDTGRGWKWFGKLTGAYFKSHSEIQQALITVEDNNFFGSTVFKSQTWPWTDEIYNFVEVNPELQIVLSVDESSYTGGDMGPEHPIAWYHHYDGGRSFYTSLGHTKESYSDSTFLNHLWKGIEFAIGDNVALDYSKSKSNYPPIQERFSKTTLSKGELFEPIEMAVLPNLDILIIQRRGEILHFRNNTSELVEVAKLNVFNEINLEEGMLGIQIDPNFKENNWVYIFYSPKSKSVNRLSRFKFIDGEFSDESEQIIIEVEAQREHCCHNGGSIAFGSDGLLYVSTGDNTNPFDENGANYVHSGFAPINDLSGKSHLDALRSSGNTNDLRGKIIRLRINEDGSYSIPEGNLFPPGTPKTRPEIYTMGHRNPYRISVDPKNNYLYWGDVGPDATNDSLQTRGPKGYDEFNQARSAGNYGWPMFVGNNFAYYNYDYLKGERGMLFDADAPKNLSGNNTGLVDLPKAQPAMIWYPYEQSVDFPELGTGGRTAMAGPVYYSDLYPQETRLPDYYDGKVFFYEWMRGWIKAVSLFENGDYNKMEPFLPNITVNSLIDMELGPDGRLYFLEYGNGWYTKNEDAGLYRIDFESGNLAPKIKDLALDKTSGEVPLSIKASINAIDLDGDAMEYIWELGNGDTVTTSSPHLDYTYQEQGAYMLEVSARDENGLKSKGKNITIVAGNSRPEVEVEIIEGNTTMYLPNVPFDYNVRIRDKEDGIAIDTFNVFIDMEYTELIEEPEQFGHQIDEQSHKGSELTQSLDCKSCHKEKDKSIGPSYLDVSRRYTVDDKDYLINKIVSGGSGAWGQVAMPGHPNLSKKELDQIVEWILSLTTKNSSVSTMPLRGTINPTESVKGKVLRLFARYEDMGVNGEMRLSGSDEVVLRNNVIKADDFLNVNGFLEWMEDGTPMVLTPSEEGHFEIPFVDLNKVTSIELIFSAQGNSRASFNFEVFSVSPEEKIIGKEVYSAKNDRQGVLEIAVDTKELRNFRGIIVKATSRNSKISSTDHLKLLAVRFSGN